MTLAKSDGTTLLQHTRDVVAALEAVLAPLLPRSSADERRVARLGAILHDLGKSHPLFQETLRQDFDPTTRRLEVPHRHEISSILLLPWFEIQEWPQLTDMVIGHHKSVRCVAGDKGRGIVDLVNDYGEDMVFARHFEQPSAWMPVAGTIMAGFGLRRAAVSEADARRAFSAALERCEGKGMGRNAWRGALMSADHLASALREETEGRVVDLFRKPDLSVFATRASETSAELFPLAKRTAESERRHTLVVAPTGAGKTDYLLRRATGRVFYLLPFQASINAMYLRLRSLLSPAGAETSSTSSNDIRRVHASSLIEISDGVEEETLLQRQPGAAIKVMTPHQLAGIVFGLAGHEALALDVAGQDVILDEVHVYSDQAQAMVMALVSSLRRLGCRIHIGSATMPSGLIGELQARLGGPECVLQVRLDTGELSTYDRHIVHKLPDEETGRGQVVAALDAGQRVLFVSNRVADSQQRFRWLRCRRPGVPSVLIHSRFRRRDRAALEGTVMAMSDSSGPCVVCSTQVIEVSLDISFDTMVTDCAPVDSLCQRFGRVNRRRRAASERRLADVFVVAPPSEGDAKPYDIQVVRRSWACLPDGKVLPEAGLQRLVDEVYPQPDTRAIDVHLVDAEDGFRLPELCNLPRSILLEALEIESAAVVRASDVDEYRRSRGENRVGLEVPVPIGSIRPMFGKWQQLREGNRPFVCPDRAYDFEEGLTIRGETDPACTIL